MNNSISLQANGYRISFHLRSLANSTRDLDLVTTFSLDPTIGNFTISSVPTFVAAGDLERLATYFEQHITHLQQNPDSEADTFVPLELGFQVKALSGDVETGDAGECSLDFKINVGSHADGSRIYVGAEGTIGIAQMRRFIAELRAALARVTPPR